MKKYIQQESGVITVWLTLLLICMLSFVLIVIECVRYNTSESICMQSGKLAIMSAMADYEPDIYDNYHIFTLDISYGQGVINKGMLKKKISNYSNISNNSRVHDFGEEINDVMGCSVKDIKVSNVNCIEKDNDNFIKQICSYMKEHTDIENDINNSISDNINYEKKQLICSYIMTHFSSYKSPHILGYMKRKNVYEVEYILMGNDCDNDNMNQIIKLFSKDDIDEENADIVCSKIEYMKKLYEELLKKDMDMICTRMKEVIVQNINNTYNKNINIEDLITSIDVEIEYSVEQRATKIYLVNQLVKIKHKDKNIVYKEEFCY